MSLAQESFLAGHRDGFTPEPETTVSEWADAHRILSGKAAAEPGRWRTDRTPYLREIMDVLSPSSPFTRIVFMKGAQIGATECGNNWIGYIIHLAPGPALMVQPTVEVAKRVSKQRIDPMIDSTPELGERVAARRSRDSGNTTFVKDFAGGMLILTGSNSGAGLRSMPIRYLFADEVDEYPGDVDDQGDPLSLAEKRTATFSRQKKILIVSTPTVKGLSRIEIEFELTDQRRFFVPCPSCGFFDWIRWENIRWTKTDDGSDDPSTTRLACVACEELIDESAKTEMLARGEWRATKPGSGRSIGFHLSALYSPLGWKSWSECVEEFIEAKEDVFKLKTWVNTVLGESWEERSTKVEPDELLARAERYIAEVPKGVGVLVASVDVQDDRLEAKVKGYGASEESWLIAYTQIHGDPATKKIWHELDDFLRQRWTHESGQKIPIECVTVDSGGHHTEEVYRFVKLRAHRRIFAVRGGNVSGVPIVGKPTAHNRYRVKLFTLCTDTAKDTIFSRLKISTPGPGFVHFPEWIDEEYTKQLTAEKALRRWKKGRGSVRSWEKIRDRNEALDLEVYCLAALNILGSVLIRRLPERAARFAAPPDSDAGRRAAEETAETADAPVRKRLGTTRLKKNSWVSGW